jgi:hypothetical protein
MGKMNAVGWFDIYVDDPFASPRQVCFVTASAETIADAGSGKRP